jgi:hypothetical protein
MVTPFQTVIRKRGYLNPFHISNMKNVIFESNEPATMRCMAQIRFFSR